MANTSYHELSIAEYVLSAAIMLRRGFLDQDRALRRGEWATAGYDDATAQPPTLRGARQFGEWEVAGLPSPRKDSHVHWPMCPKPTKPKRMTPHSSGVTADTFAGRADGVTANVGRLARGETLQNVVAR